MFFKSDMKSYLLQSENESWFLRVFFGEKRMLSTSIP